VFRRRHRQCVQEYLSSLDRKLEIEVTTDTVNFWENLKSRKTSRKAVAGAGIVFNGEV